MIKRPFDYTRLVADTCYECTMCIRECDFLLHIRKSPLDLAKAALQDGYTSDPLTPYSCNLCGYCRNVCPENLDIGLMVQEIRENLVSMKIGPLPGHHSIVEGQKSYESDNSFVISAGIDTMTCERVFFPGCALSAYSSKLVRQTYLHLVSLS